MYTVLVAADVYGVKQNFEVTFPGPAPPSLPELTRQVESIYGVECASKRPVGLVAKPFLVGRFQLYDERVQQWVDLGTPGQLSERAQLYVLPPEDVIPVAPVPVPQPSFQPGPVPVAPERDGWGWAAPPAMAPAAAAGVPPQQVVYAPPVAPAGFAPAAHHMPPAPATAVAARPILPDNATFDDKIRATFDELDANKNRVLEQEELRRGFELCRVDFSSATVSELAAKADANKDGVVSLEEWQRFAEKYPTLIDSFYFRFKAHWENVHRQQDIAAAKEFLCEMKEREQAAKVVWLEAQRESDAARARLSAQESALAQAADAQRAAEQALLEARRDVERAAADRAAREHELAAQREREARAAHLHADTARDTEAAAARLAQAQAETAAAQEQERQAQQVLQSAQAEVERQRQLTAQRSGEVTDARSREQAAALAAAESARDATLAGERLSRADVDVAAKQQREVELDGQHTQQQQDTAHSAARRDEEVHHLQVQRDQEEAAHAGRLDAQRLVEEADRRVVALEAENTAFNQRRRQVEEQEAPLLNQEIRLRAQRDSLEEKEAKLRGDHRSFQETALLAPAPPPAAAPFAPPPAPAYVPVAAAATPAYASPAAYAPPVGGYAPPPPPAPLTRAPPPPPGGAYSDAPYDTFGRVPVVGHGAYRPSSPRPVAAAAYAPRPSPGYAPGYDPQGKSFSSMP